MARPTNPVLIWSTDVLDPNGALLKEEPPVEIQQTGTLFEQPWVRTWLNYMFNNLTEYIQFIADEPIGTFKMSTVQVADPTLEWGGTWTEESGVSIGAATVFTYEKTGL
jgi:hypothetical protein